MKFDQKSVLATILACVVLGAFIGVLSLFAPARGDGNLFPFVIEQGAPDNITNVQTWDGASFKEIDSDGFVQARQGEFRTDSDKTRLFGTNLSCSALFCSHEKADRLAESLARFGVGSVRLHRMDWRNIWDKNKGDIWGKNFDQGTPEFDPDQLEKFDYLVSRLYAKGIKVSLNLHVSRVAREIDGFENAARLPRLTQGVNNFDRRMIEFQKDYARDLLTHVNPYTGRAYIDDPGVTTIEINNENSILASWIWGLLDDLPEPYAHDFMEMWNQWLLKKYKSTDGLREAWNRNRIPLGEEQIKVGVFKEGFQFGDDTNWILEDVGGSEWKSRTLPPEEIGVETDSLRFTVKRADAQRFFPRFKCVGLHIKKGRPYQIHFRARSYRTRSFNLSVVPNTPWESTGFEKEFVVDREWKVFDLSFISPIDDDASLVFKGFMNDDSLEFTDVSFREGSSEAPAINVSLEKGEVDILRGVGGAGKYGVAAADDFIEFLHDVENDFFQEMYDYVKSLGAKSLVMGTQLKDGFLHNQARLDYCDVHAYWGHPKFPSGWNSDNWVVGNACLADNPLYTEMTRLGIYRIIGKPFVCSEYDHTYPNFYATEGNLIYSAIASFQDWSAIYQYAWAHDDNFEPEMATQFFNMCSEQTKMAHLPACYAIFSRGDVQAGPGKFAYIPKLTERDELDAIKRTITATEYYHPLTKRLGYDGLLSLAVYCGIDLADPNIEAISKVAEAQRVSSWQDLPEDVGSPEKREIANEFGEVKWNFKKDREGYFVVDTARTKVFSGFVTKPCEFDALTLDIGKTNLGWATVSFVKAKNVDGTEKKDGVISKGSYLLTATGESRNTGEVRQQPFNEHVTSASECGGSMGKAPALCEGIPATITLPGVSGDAVSVYALDASGARAKEVPVADKNGAASFKIGSKYRTIWYEVVVR